MKSGLRLGYIGITALAAFGNSIKIAGADIEPASVDAVRSADGRLLEVRISDRAESTNQSSEAQEEARRLFAYAQTSSRPETRQQRRARERREAKTARRK